MATKREKQEEIIQATLPINEDDEVIEFRTEEEETKNGKEKYPFVYKKII